MPRPDAFEPIALHTCYRKPATADTTPHLYDLLQAACARGDVEHFEAINFVMGLLHPLGVPLESPRDGREMSGRGFSFRLPRGPWVLWLVERLYGDLPGDVGGGAWLGHITEGLWVARPEPSALDVDYTEGGGQCAPCNEPRLPSGERAPRLRYEAFAPGPVVRPNGAVDVAATLQRLRDAFPAAPPGPTCAACRATGKLRRCAGCRTTLYCSTECQRADWRAHKRACRQAQAQVPAPAAARAAWWEAHRKKTEDGTEHFGRLELMTWRCVDEDGDELGFAGFVASEDEEVRREFQDKYGGDEARYFEYRPEGFRWTCCGVAADIGTYGCDHHGDPRAPSACRCDFCRAGRPLDEGTWRRKLASQAARGLEGTLCRGRHGPSTPGGDLNWAFRGIFHPEAR